MTQTPQTLHHPRYRFDRWIAGGGMGDVWAATDTLLERPVAVKVLKQQYADDPVFRSRFAAEARHAAALQHPHVATVLDYGELLDSDRSPVPFLVMELVQGRPLSALLTDGRPLRPEVAQDLVAQAADGVAAAHRVGIVHRDVKPANLLVTPDGQVKVTDFGVARAGDAAPLTLTGQLVGTPHYLSPEQVEGATATPASDVYALGIVLFECLTGRRPFVGETAVATALMQVRDPLPALPDSVPESLQEVTRRATAKDPAARFPSMETFASALRSSPLDATAALPVTQNLPVGTGNRTRMRRLGAVFGSIVAIMLVVGAGWAVVTRQNGNARTSDSGQGGASAPSTPRPGKVRVRAAAYVGLPVGVAVRKLRRLGFEVTSRVRPNPGGDVAGTVAGIGPVGLLTPGSRVVLSVWGPVAASPTPGTGPGPAGPGAGGHGKPGPGKHGPDEHGHPGKGKGGPHPKPKPKPKPKHHGPGKH